MLKHDNIFYKLEYNEQHICKYHTLFLLFESQKNYKYKRHKLKYKNNYD